MEWVTGRSILLSYALFQLASVRSGFEPATPGAQQPTAEINPLTLRVFSTLPHRPTKESFTGVKRDPPRLQG